MTFFTTTIDQIVTNTANPCFWYHSTLIGPCTPYQILRLD